MILRKVFSLIGSNKLWALKFAFIYYFIMGLGGVPEKLLKGVMLLPLFQLLVAVGIGWFLTGWKTFLDGKVYSFVKSKSTILELPLTKDNEGVMWSYVFLVLIIPHFFTAYFLENYLFLRIIFEICFNAITIFVLPHIVLARQGIKKSFIASYSLVRKVLWKRFFTLSILVFPLSFLETFTRQNVQSFMHHFIDGGLLGFLLLLLLTLLFGVISIGGLFLGHLFLEIMRAVLYLEATESALEVKKEEEI